MEPCDIVFTGFHCVRESAFDSGFSNSDEPYFLFATTDGRTTRTRRTSVFDDIDSGDTRRLDSRTGFSIWGTRDLETERDVLCIVASAMEEDGGAGGEAEALLKKAVAGAVTAGAGALGVPGGGLAGAVAAEIAAELSGVEDDVIAVTGLVLTREELRRLARSKPRRFGDEGIGYHIVLRFRGDEEGTYFAFLRVEGPESAEASAVLDEIDLETDELDIRRLGAESSSWTAAAASPIQSLYLSRYLDKAETRDADGDSTGAYWRWRGSALQASHVVAGSFVGRGTEFLLYSATEGRYTLVLKGSTRQTDTGKVSEGSHTILGGGKMISGATAVVPGTFSDRAHEENRTDLLVYRKDGGRQEFYSVRKSGAVRIPDNFKNWRSDWDLIVPVDFPGRKYTSLFLYSRSGEAEIWHMTEPGTIARFSSHRISRFWTFICQAMLQPGADPVSLFFYSRERGLARLVSFPSLTRHSERSMPTYDLLVPVHSLPPASLWCSKLLGIRSE